MAPGGLFPRDDSLPDVIGLTGRAGSGKDSFYRLVLAPLGYHRVAISDPLKAAALYLDVVEHSQGQLRDDMGRVMTGHYSYHVYKTPREREILQQMGGKWMTGKYGPGFLMWVAMGHIQYHLQRGEKVVVTDVRYDLEAQVLRGNKAHMESVFDGVDPKPPQFQPLTAHVNEKPLPGLLPTTPAKLVRLVRTNQPTGTFNALDAHESETGTDLIDVDYTIEAEDLEGLWVSGKSLMAMFRSVPG